MLSSTFVDLESFRRTAEICLQDKGFFIDWMEADGARPGIDIIDSSLEKVSGADGYLLILGERYGSPIKCSDRNPGGLSTTHLEYRKALEHNIPIASIILNKNCWPRSDREDDSLWNKRNDFEKEVSSSTGEICGYVKDTIDFQKEIIKAADGLIVALGGYKESPQEDVEDIECVSANLQEALRKRDRIPSPAAPDFHEARPFVQGMRFIGREADLRRLDDWLGSGEPMFVYAAMGGMGKSTVVHQWAKHNAAEVTPNLAGRFWYSFYEEGASIADFCQHALAYIDGETVSAFDDMSRAQMREALLDRLNANPFLLVMDGLERLLRAYASSDRAGKPAESKSVEKTEAREKQQDYFCSLPEDGRFLQDLLSVAPGKLIITTRNLPEELRNEAHQPKSGICHHYLEGLEGPDAVALLKAAGVYGDEVLIAGFVSREFGGHPLMIGIIAGIVREYAPAPGDFNAWKKDPKGHAALDLAKLDSLNAKRHHVLEVVLDSLEEDERLVLTALALLPYGISYEHIQSLTGEIASRREENALPIDAALTSLRQRGLLSYAEVGRIYDLHPLVRAVVREWESGDLREDVGGAVVDYTRSRAPDLLDEQSSGAEVDRVLDVAEAMLTTGQETAIDFIATLNVAEIVDKGRTRRCLGFLQQASAQIGSPAASQRHFLIQLLEARSSCHRNLREHGESLSLTRESLELSLAEFDRSSSRNGLLGALQAAFLSTGDAMHYAECWRWLSLAERCVDSTDIYQQARHDFLKCVALIKNGKGERWRLEAPYAHLDNPDRFAGAETYRRDIWYWRAVDVQQRDDNPEAEWQALIKQYEGSADVRLTIAARGMLANYYTYQEQLELAGKELRQARDLALSNDLPISALDALQALILAKQGNFDEAGNILDRRSKDTDQPQLYIGEAFYALGDTEKAKQAALRAYRFHWADGPPYANAHYLEQAGNLLQKLGVTPPKLPYVTPETLPPDPLYDRALKAVELLEAERESDND